MESRWWEQLKVCPECRVEKDVWSFSPNTRVCKPCKNKKTQASRIKTPRDSLGFRNNRFSWKPESNPFSES